MLQARFQVFRLSIFFKSKKEKKEATHRWVEALAPVGSNPFMRQYIYKTWAGALSPLPVVMSALYIAELIPDIADSDFNMHLSNSSYPKVHKTDLNPL